MKVGFAGDQSKAVRGQPGRGEIYGQPADTSARVFFSVNYLGYIFGSEGLLLHQGSRAGSGNGQRSFFTI